MKSEEDDVTAQFSFGRTRDGLESIPDVHRP